MVLGFGAGSLKRPLVKKCPWWFWGLGRDPPRGTWSKRTLGGFGVWGGVLQEGPGQKGPLVVLGFQGMVLQKAPGQKGPLVVLGFGVRSSKGPWSKGPLMVLEARARPWSKRAPGGFGVWVGVLREAPGQKDP